MRHRLPRLVPLFLLSLIACKKERTFPTERGHRIATKVAASDEAAVCSDVAALRVCWGPPARYAEHCENGFCVEPRPVPNIPSPSAGGWRCAGYRERRTCTSREYGAGRFECEGRRCVQAHIRVPDDGEWTCAESAGATICTGGALQPAGVPSPVTDSGWLCGNRAGSPDRVCVDFSPDLPTPHPERWQCQYEGTSPQTRRCVVNPDSPRLGASCSAKQPCVDGARCVRGLCLPAPPEPTCWLDSDCASRACRFGTCRGS